MITELTACTLCANCLPYPPKPIFQWHPDARLLIVGQAPGRKAHEVGLPFADASGERLRSWLGLDRDSFYDARRVAILPMGFCYPGGGKAGDLPPRPECAITWRGRLLPLLQGLRLTLVIGQYAQAYHLPVTLGASVTDTVKAWRQFWPDTVPLPHPSPRNNLWLRRNPWFESELLPELRSRVVDVLAEDVIP